MSGKDNKQNRKQKTIHEHPTATSAGDTKSSTGSKSTTVKSSQGIRGFLTGSRFAAGPDFVDIPLDDDPPPRREDPDWVVVKKPEYSAYNGQGDHWRRYEAGNGKEDEDKDVDPNYEMVEKPQHSAYNGQGDNWRKYEGDTFVKGEPMVEKTLWQRFSSLWK